MSVLSRWLLIPPVSARLSERGLSSSWRVVFQRGAGLPVGDSRVGLHPTGASALAADPCRT